MAFKLMACGSHRKNVTHNLSKVNHFYIEIPSYLKVTAETVVFSPNKSLRFLSYRTMPMFIDHISSLGYVWLNTT